MACIWDLNKRSRGKLLQGYQAKGRNYVWDFPVDNFDNGIEDRKFKVQEKLKAARKERDEDKAYKKQRDLAQRKYGHLRSSLGFSGAVMLGLTEETITSSGVHT